MHWERSQCKISENLKNINLHQSQKLIRNENMKTMKQFYLVNWLRDRAKLMKIWDQMHKFALILEMVRDGANGWKLFYKFYYRNGKQNTTGDL